MRETEPTPFEHTVVRRHLRRARDAGAPCTIGSLLATISRIRGHYTLVTRPQTNSLRHSVHNYPATGLKFKNADFDSLRLLISCGFTITRWMLRSRLLNPLNMQHDPVFDPGIVGRRLAQKSFALDMG